MSDGSDGIVDGEKKGAKSEFGKRDLEEGFIDCGRGEDRNNLFWRDFIGGARKGEVE
jgi:hypothetical protein